jgi:hypothetical protein
MTHARNHHLVVEIVTIAVAIAITLALSTTTAASARTFNFNSREGRWSSSRCRPSGRAT